MGARKQKLPIPIGQAVFRCAQYLVAAVATLGSLLCAERLVLLVVRRRRGGGGEGYRHWVAWSCFDGFGGDGDGVDACAGPGGGLGGSGNGGVVGFGGSFGVGFGVSRFGSGGGGGSFDIGFGGAGVGFGGDDCGVRGIDRCFVLVSDALDTWRHLLVIRLFAVVVAVVDLAAHEALVQFLRCLGTSVFGLLL